jgi:hypothetical protein
LHVFQKIKEDTMNFSVWMMIFLIEIPQFGWEFHEVGSFPEVGDCTSAVADSGFLVVGCRSGLWVGPLDGNLRKVISCKASSAHPIQVVVYQKGVLVASTPCGLYRIEAGKIAERIPLPAPPKALAASGHAELVVLIEGELLSFRGSRFERRHLSYGIEKEGLEQLGISDARVLALGRHLKQLGVGGVKTYLPPSGKSLSSLLGANILWVNPEGRLWRQTLGEPAVSMASLGLQVGERVHQVIGLDDGRVFVSTERRWFVIHEKNGVVSGFLPVGAGDLVPIRFLSSSMIPWIVKGGQMFRPVWKRTSQVSWCSHLREWSELKFSLASLESGPTQRRAGLPRLDARFCGVGVHDASHGPGGWNTTHEQRWFAGLVLSWRLDSPDKEAGLREAVRKRRSRLRRSCLAQARRLLAERQLICQGSDGLESRLALKSVVYRLWALSKALTPLE